MSNVRPIVPAQGIQLTPAIVPLQVIAALSALVFVFNFSFEILYAYKSSSAHLKLLLGLVSALSVWAIVECLMVMKQQTSHPFRWLLGLLLAQLAIVLLRGGQLSLDLQLEQAGDWMVQKGSSGRWHFVFLLPYAIVFLGIYKTIVSLFTLNEAIRAKNTEKQMLVTLNAMAMARDNETGNHILRTQNYVRILALRLRAMGLYQEELTDSFIELLFDAAPLHDIGKVGIPDGILHKANALSPEEWRVMQTHTTLGETILTSASGSQYSPDHVLGVAIAIAGGHHEKWDGTGYPRGLSQKKIPLSARIMALADMYDALVSERVYKNAWTHEDAAAEIVRISGTHLDPDVVMAFIAEQPRFLEIATQYRD